MMSKNSTLRCPASTMYSTALATTPDIASLDNAGLSIDMFLILQLLARLKADRLRRTLILVNPRCPGNRRAPSGFCSHSGIGRWRTHLIVADPRPHQFPRHRQDDRSDEEAND